MLRLILFILLVSMVPHRASALKVAVTGTTGLLGRQIVARLSKNNIKVIALLRHPIDDSIKPSIVVITANSKSDSNPFSFMDLCDEFFAHNTICIDITNSPVKPPPIQSLFRLLPESDPVHSRSVNYVAIQNIIDAVKESRSCTRIVRVTGKGEEPTSFFTVLINMLGNMAKAWNYEGEQLLRTSGVDYTIIRPGVMGRNDIPTKKVRALADNGQDLKVTAVTHSQIAELCCDCLNFSNTAKSTLTAMNVDEGEGADSYDSLLELVKPDTRVFPSTLLEEHKRGARNGAAILASFIAVFASVTFAALKSILWGIFH